MKRHGLSEEEAFKRIRKASMDSRKTMREIAEAILLADKMGG
jgi:AmiR/NasT family two-component response regulator